jgi:hypothetical protein
MNETVGPPPDRFEGVRGGNRGEAFVGKASPDDISRNCWSAAYKKLDNTIQYYTKQYYTTIVYYTIL